MKLVNTNEHRIYVGDDRDVIVRAGGTFDGSKEDLDRPGVERFREDGDYPDAPTEGVESVSAAHAQGVADLAREAARKGHEQLRDKLDADGHAVPGTADEPAGELPPERPPATGTVTSAQAAPAAAPEVNAKQPKKELQAVADREGVAYSKRDTREQLVEKINAARG